MPGKSQTPALRFAGFTGDWVERRLGESCTLQGGNAWKSVDYCDGGTHLVVTITNVSGEDEVNDSVGKYIDAPLNSEYILQKGDILISLTGNVGRVSRMSSKPAVLNQRVARVFLKEGELQNDYVFAILRNPRFERSMIDSGQGAAQKNISNKDVLDYCFTAPRTLIEQSAIGRFFREVDALIAQQQKKVEKLQGLKKGLMKKMFPRGGRTLPEVRFAGFDGEWVESRFPDLFVYLKNNTLSRACQANEGSDVQNIHYGDVLVKYSNCVDPESDRIPHILKEKLSESIQSCFLTNGDIIIADTAEDTTAGKCCELLLYTDRKIVSGLHTIPCRPVRQFGCGFLGYYLNSESYRKQLYPLMQGIKVISISRGSLQTTEVCFPDSKSEQTSIGRLFRKLDTHITLHGQKLEKLRHVKQALLGRMFV